MVNNKLKKILSLEGGGIRGTLILGFLEKIEKELGENETNTLNSLRFLLDTKDI